MATKTMEQVTRYSTSYYLADGGAAHGKWYRTVEEAEAATDKIIAAWAAKGVKVREAIIDWGHFNRHGDGTVTRGASGHKHWHYRAA